MDIKNFWILSQCYCHANVTIHISEEGNEKNSRWGWNTQHKQNLCIHIKRSYVQEAFCMLCVDNVLRALNVPWFNSTREKRSPATKNYTYFKHVKINQLLYKQPPAMLHTLLGQEMNEWWSCKSIFTISQRKHRGRLAIFCNNKNQSTMLKYWIVD